MVIEVGLVGVQEVINGYRSCLLVPKGLYWAWKCCRLTADGVIHETLTFKDDRLANFELRYVGDGHRSRPCWGTGGDQRLLQLSIGTKGSLLCVEVV